MLESTILAIERHALAAWPAREVEELDGWRLRATDGVTRRANSAWTAETLGRLSLEARLERVEAFYAQRGLPSVAQLVPALGPPELDAMLARRGYRMEAPVSVQIADARQLAPHEPESPAATTRVAGRLFEEWFDVSCRRGRFAAVEASYRGLLERLGDRAAYALASVDGQPAAVGMGVMGGQWCGLFSMLTLTTQRRRGLARAIVGALARHALGRGATRLYLQVERDNRPALALYQRSGFAELYGYHYRIRDRIQAD